MKKTLSIVLAALMLLLALAACGEDAKPETTDPATEAPATEATQAPETEAPAAVDINKKDEGVLTYAEFMALEDGKDAVIEGFLQAKYDFAEAYGNTSFFLCDGDGAYYAYRATCTAEEYAKLEIGAKVKVTGQKGSYAGEIEMAQGCTFEVVGTDKYVAEVLDITASLEAEDLIKNQNKAITVKGAEIVASTVDGKDSAFLYKYNGTGAQGDDLYFNIKVGEKTYTYCVESDFCSKDSDVYKAVEAMKIGDKIDLEGMLYWYNAAQVQVTSVKAAQ